MFKWKLNGVEAKESESQSQSQSQSQSESQSSPIAKIDFDSQDIFFAQQEIHNACATQAILHILLNLSESAHVNLGDVLENFGCFAKELPVDMRGLCLSNSLEIREIHNEFGNLSEMLAFGDEDDELDENDKKNSDGSRDPFHFVAFIEKNGRIYELDGLKKGPIFHGSVSNSDSTGQVLDIIKKRISSSASFSSTETETETDSEVRYNLMALVPDRRVTLQKELDALISGHSNAAAAGHGNHDDNDAKTSEFLIQQELAEAEAKWSQYRKEWASRREECEKMQRSKSNRLSNVNTMNLNKNNNRTKSENLSSASSSSVQISSQVQDLLKSLAGKGLFPK